MIDSKTPLDFLSLALALIGALAGAHILVERLFNYSLFTTFIKITPTFLRNMFPNAESILWFENRNIQKSIYDSWYLSFIFLLILLSVFFLTAGFWIFLILRLISIFYIPLSILIIWFFIIFII